jgi:hypothetical protein
MTKRKIIADNTAAQATLHAGAGSSGGIQNNSDAETAIDYMMKLSRAKKQEWIDYLQKSLEDSAWAKSGGVPDSYAERSKQSLRTNEELRQDLEDAGFSEELQDKCVQLFSEAVESKQNKLRDGLIELFQDHPHFLIMLEGNDAIELLVNRIDFLNDEIAYVEEQSQELVEEIREQAGVTDEALFEEAMYQARPTKAKRNYNEDMFEPDEGNEWLREEKTTFTDPKMKMYLDAVNRSFPKQ